MKHKTDKNVQQKLNLWLVWTEECRSANGACPCMRVNSVGRGWRRGRRGVVGRILQCTRWRKRWGLHNHRRRLATGFVALIHAARVRFPFWEPM